MMQISKEGKIILAILGIGAVVVAVVALWGFNALINETAAATLKITELKHERGRSQKMNAESRY